MRQIGTIGNYYGSLLVKKDDKGCWWAIENYDGCQWEQIPQSLYDELIKFEDQDYA